MYSCNSLEVNRRYAMLSKIYGAYWCSQGGYDLEQCTVLVVENSCTNNQFFENVYASRNKWSTYRPLSNSFLTSYVHTMYAYMKWVRADCPACRTTLVATRFRVAVICPIIQVPHGIRVLFYFVWFVFINHIFQFYNELCTYCNILDIYLS